MKLAFHSFGYGSFALWVPSYSLEDTIRRVADLGYDGIELGALRPHAWPADLDSSARARTAALLASLNLQCAAICPTSNNYNLASSLPTERQDAVAYYIECVQLASDLDCPTLVTIPGWAMEGTLREQALLWSIEGLSRIVPHAERLCVTLAIEPVCRFMTNLITDPQQALDLLAQLGSDAVQVMLDTSHMQLEGQDPDEAVTLLGRHLVHMHVEDGDGRSFSRRVPGKGTFAWDRLFDALESVGYKGFLSAEIWGTDADSLARESLAALSSMTSKRTPAS